MGSSIVAFTPVLNMGFAFQSASPSLNSHSPWLNTQAQIAGQDGFERQRFVRFRLHLDLVRKQFFHSFDNFGRLHDNLFRQGL